MTKAELRSLVKNAVGRMDKKTQYPLRLIEFAIEAALNQLYIDMFKTRSSDLDPFIVTVEAVVNPYTGGYYTNKAVKATYPISGTILGVSRIYEVVPLPDKAGGCRAVREDAETPTLEFYPMTRREAEYYAATTLSNTETATNIVGYVTLKDKVDLYGNKAATSTLTKVELDIVPTFTTTPDTTHVTESYGQSINVLGYVLKYLGIVQPVDLKDDNSEMTWQNKTLQRQ